MDPARDLAIYLASLGVGSTAKPASGWWIVTGQLVADPLPQIAVLDTGGTGPQIVLNGGVAYRRPSVQLLFLGAAGDYNGTRAKVEAVLGAITKPSGVTANGTPYLSWQPVQEPIWLGYRHEDQRPMWSVNVDLVV